MDSSKLHSFQDHSSFQLYFTPSLWILLKKEHFFPINTLLWLVPPCAKNSQRWILQCNEWATAGEKKKKKRLEIAQQVDHPDDTIWNEELYFSLLFISQFKENSRESKK